MNLNEFGMQNMPEINRLENVFKHKLDILALKMSDSKMSDKTKTTRIKEAKKNNSLKEKFVKRNKTKTKVELSPFSKGKSPSYSLLDFKKNFESYTTSFGFKNASPDIKESKVIKNTMKKNKIVKTSLLIEKIKMRQKIRKSASTNDIGSLFLSQILDNQDFSSKTTPFL